MVLYGMQRYFDESEPTPIEELHPLSVQGNGMPFLSGKERLRSGR